MFYFVIDQLVTVRPTKVNDKFPILAWEKHVNIKSGMSLDLCSFFFFNKRQKRENQLTLSNGRYDWGVISGREPNCLAWGFATFCILLKFFQKCKYPYPFQSVLYPITPRKETKWDSTVVLQLKNRRDGEKGNKIQRQGGKHRI